VWFVCILRYASSNILIDGCCEKVLKKSLKKDIALT